MKKHLLLILFVAFSIVMIAQQMPRLAQLGNQKHTETYINKFGKDSLKYTILGQHDTLLTEKFRENGHLESRKWRNDSTYNFDAFGRLRTVLYPPNEAFWFPNIGYYFNGEIKQRFIQTSTGSLLETFKLNGALNTRRIEKKLSPMVSYITETDDKGNILYAERSDTLIPKGDSTVFMQYDTAFYVNGGIFSTNQQKITYVNSRRDYADWREKSYNQGGDLRLDVLKGAHYLTAFKDNVDCYYGLKNEKGDTIYPAQFDQVERLFMGDFWLAHQGTQVKLIREDGSLLTDLPMTQIEPIESSYNTFQYHKIMQSNKRNAEIWYHLMDNPDYFTFQSGGKFGVMGSNGNVILPPQYPKVQDVDSAGLFFSVSDKDKKKERSHFFAYSDYSVQKVVDRQGNYFLNDRYPYVAFTESPDFFAFSKTEPSDTNHFLYEGLITKSGEVLLEDIYTSVNVAFGMYQQTPSTHTNGLFWVEKSDMVDFQDRKRRIYEATYGIYDPVHRRWVLPCIYRLVNDYGDNTEFILQDTLTRKYGIVSASGAVILPFDYEYIGHTYGANICTVLQNGQYQIYDITRQRMDKTTYQHLIVHTFANDYSDVREDFKTECTSNIAVFVAQKDDKWGIVDFNGKVIVPLTYAYVGEGNGLAFVKNNQADVISDRFFPEPNIKNDRPGTSNPKLETYYLLNNVSPLYRTGTFVVSEQRVLLPPQYKRVQSGTDWQIMENDTKQRLLLFNALGVVAPFPFSDHVEWVHPNNPITVLRYIKREEADTLDPFRSGYLDKKRLGFEVKNRRTGQLYQRIESGAVAIADRETGTYFIKTDAPPPIKSADRPKVWLDTFLIDDNNWQLHDSTGKTLITNTFRYPIPFKDGIGIGAMGEKFGVWRLDGSVLIPPQYDNARFWADDKRILLYQNRGLKTWLLMADRSGKILIGAGRYDGISTFYGKYALVSLGDKTGLVDTLGREIITPTSLENDQFNLMDSLNIVNILHSQRLSADKKKYSNYYDYHTRLPISVYRENYAAIHPDSFLITNTLRNRIWHYLLQTQLENAIYQADSKDIVRAETFKHYDVYEPVYPHSQTPKKLRYLFADSTYISFTLILDSAAQSLFKNYIHTQKGWAAQELSDILNLSRDNTIKINDLLREKLKKLEDKEIDCGESASFVERTQNAFLAHAKGISFYFSSNKYDSSSDDNTSFHYVPILLTWGELKGVRRF